MSATTELEGIFNNIKDSVDRLDGRVAGVEHRIAVMSYDLNKECQTNKVVIELPAETCLILHLVLGLIIAIIVLRIVNCMVGGII